MQWSECDLTLASMESSDLATKRFRLPDSDMSVSDMQTALQRWFHTNASSNVDALLSFTDDWPKSGVVKIDAWQLCLKAPYTLVGEFVVFDKTLHPRHARLTAALLNEHSKPDRVEPCIVSSRPPAIEAMKLAQRLLAVMARYRELVKYSYR